MKKVLLMLLVLFMGFAFLGCKENERERPVKKAVVKYCNWNFGTEEENNLTRRMVEKFNSKSTTIRIEIMEPSGDYDTFLTTMAAGNNLPDVFMVNNVPTAVINQWALDISEFTTKDSEWNDINETLRNAITYNDKVYAVPSGQYYMGLIANLDLIDRYITGNQSASEVFESGKFDVEKWFQTVKEIKDINKTDGTGVIGMNATGDIINWLPSTLDTTGKMKHFVWDQEKFDYTGELLKDALTKIADLGSKTGQYVLDTVPTKINEEDETSTNWQQIFGAQDATTIFCNGQMGFIQDGSWAAYTKDLDFEYRFISYPNGKVVSSTDFFCISRSAENKEAAYEVAKYLTFSEEGLNDLFSVIEENKDAKLTLTGLPINTKEAIINKWFSYINVKGLKELFVKAQNDEVEIIIEGNKYVPGFIQARFKFNTGISIPEVRNGDPLTIGDFIWEVCGGNISLNDFNTNMTQALCDKINEEIDTAYTKMGLTR